MKNYLLVVLLGLFLSACGGGDGGGEDPESYAFTFSPSSISETYAEGESISFSVVATPTNPLSGAVYVYIIDTTGVIQPNVQITANLDGTYTANMTTSSTLPVGTYQGRIEVKVCSDPACTSQFSGSPDYVNFNVQVVSSTNLTPLVQWPNVNGWETYQANAAHTGYVPVTLDANNFSPRWRWAAPESGNKVSPAVAANGLVYVSSSGYSATSSTVYALNESDSSVNWQYDFGAVSALNPPAVSGGKVFVATSGHADTIMWGFAADIGVQQFSTQFSAQWDHYYAPTVHDGAVYTNGGYYGGLNSFSATDGSDRWYTSLNQYDEWTPAVDDNYVYAYLGDSCSGCNNAGLNIINKITGVIVYTFNDPLFDWNGWSINGSPIVGSNNTVYSINQAKQNYTNHLISYNIQALSINWSLPGIFQVNPALANGVIYLANNSPLQLEARDEVSGHLLWTWSPADPDESFFYGNVIATDNMLFVSTNKRTYAIDINSHSTAWKYWKAGELAISENGVLYITPSDGYTNDGTLVAINLK